MDQKQKSNPTIYQIIMVEEIIYYQELNSKYGIISYPTATVGKDLPLVIFLNAGMVNRQGPNRIYVNICRELSKLGFNCFRFDLPGIGDNFNSGKFSTKHELYRYELKTVVDYFLDTGTCGSFLLLGLCSGADLAYNFSFDSSAISGVCMINGTKLPKSSKSKSKIKKRYYKKYFTDKRRWAKIFEYRKLLKIHKKVAYIFNKVFDPVRLSAPFRRQEKKHRAAPDDLNSILAWTKLLTSDLEILQVVSEGSETYDDFKNLDKKTLEFNGGQNNYCQHIIYDADHTFTSLASQEALIKVVFNWCKDKFIDKIYDLH